MVDTLVNPPLPDQASRDAAIRERARNVLVDAGAGTGKTHTIVERLVHMIAPPDDGPAVSINRVAAITFTRKAAGELRLRIRERLLDALAREPAASLRAGRLKAALDGLDTAFVGTVHGFADRLLRLRPVEAELSPSYEVTEDAEGIVDETVQWLLHAVEEGTLVREFEGTALEERARVADEGVRAALAAGIAAETREMEFVDLYGLDALARGFIRYRDVPPVEPPLAPLDTASFTAAMEALLGELAPVTAGTDGARRLIRLRDGMRRVLAAHLSAEPGALFGEIRRLFDGVPRDLRKGYHFPDDEVGWAACKALPAHRERVEAPLAAWLAARLLRVAPIVVALCERVKARRRELDELDLLERLRNLLVRDRDARAFYQSLFDHIFVDEFQDTDPLQAEIVLLLCERGANAARWDEVVVAPGTLTLVGDPKQSIYRFRRADIEMYDTVRRQVLASGEVCEARLETNLRSTAPLVEWFNDRFSKVLGTPPGEDSFDVATGRVYYSPLRHVEPAAALPSGGSPAIHVVPIDFGDGGKHQVDEYRRLEASAIAAYVRHLVGAGWTIRDPAGGGTRPVRFGDIAILTVSTYGIGPLFGALDEARVPYASRGGTLLLSDPLHRQFMLALRALSDRRDGVARAALLRPPFFAIDPADLLAAEAVRHGWEHPDAVSRSEVLEEAEAIVGELRASRFERSPGATARELLERTACARVVAARANGVQRLARLQFLACELDLLAAREGLDFDGVTKRVREWVVRPVHLDPPHPVDAAAVQVLTIHQAKGLEFPVVIWWDGRAVWNVRLQPEPWRIGRDGRDWVMSLHRFEHASDEDLKAREKQYLDQERRRLVYVAATRARDLLVLPRTGTPMQRFICTELLDAAPEHLVEEMAPFIDGALPDWAQGGDVGQPERAPVDGTALAARTEEQWTRAAEAAAPRLVPVPVSKAAAKLVEVSLDVAPVEADAAEPAGRFGPVFGTVVHRAIALVIEGTATDAAAAVAHAARESGLTEHLEDAVQDVVRAVEALRASGLLRAGADRAVEYPVSGATADGSQLLVGAIDFVQLTDAEAVIVDFKTDAPPKGGVEETYPEYVAQVAAYGRLLQASGAIEGRTLRCALLFTADGTWHEVRGAAV